MAKGLKHGAGGGTSLNFKVVGGTSTPASPKENTIWINTNTAVSSWDFSATQPVLRSANKNLLILDVATATKSGLAFTVNSDKSITINGTSTAAVTLKLSSLPINKLLEIGKTYTFKGTGHSSIYIGASEYTPAGAHVKTHTIKTNSDNSFVYNGIEAIENVLTPLIYIQSGVTINSFTVYPQLEKGSTATSYVKGDATGQVWITTGASSTAPFNALKKNNITVYPISAKQYVSGAWVDKEAKSYQNGAWVDWYNGELYREGDQYENVTGGWKKSALTWSGLPTNGTISYGEYLTVKANSGGYYDATTVNKLDLTEYSQLRYDIASDSATDDTIVVIHQKESGVIWSSTPYWTASSNDGILPLTGISGLYYISVLAMNNKTIKVGNIRLVK